MVLIALMLLIFFYQHLFSNVLLLCVWILCIWILCICVFEFCVLFEASVAGKVALLQNLGILPTGRTLARDQENQHEVSHSRNCHVIKATMEKMVIWWMIGQNVNMGLGSLSEIEKRFLTEKNSGAAGAAVGTLSCSCSTVWRWTWRTWGTSWRSTISQTINMSLPRVTLNWRVTMSVMIVVLNCQKCDFWDTDHISDNWEQQS